MDKLLFFVAGMVVGGFLMWCIQPDKQSDDDPTGEKKQEIFDTLTSIKEDLEKTV